ncbi:MAG: arylsulfotransferase family protein [Planctomycetota bacterium]
MRTSLGKLILLAGLGIGLGVVLMLRVLSGPEGQESAGGESEAGETEQQSAETGKRAGRWAKQESRDEALTPEQQESIEQLEAIGYTGGSFEASSNASGVTVYQKERVDPGFNLYTSGHGPEAILLDMEGNELHRWRHSFFDIWPDSDQDPEGEPVSWWRRTFLCDNGDLLAIFEGQAIIKLDRNSELLWASPIGAHHDLEVLPDGDVLVLTREAHMLPRISQAHPILEDFISVLDSAGREKSRLSLIEAFENSEFMDLWLSSADPKKRRPGDIFHTNTLALLDGRIADKLKEFRAGNLLISVRQLNTIAVVDPEQKRVVWARRGDFVAQHDPSVLENGNLLLFDNRGGWEGRSRVLELDPATFRTVWTYEGTAEKPFFSRALGTAQRLPNGNTLITESDRGRAFEVTPEKEIVWEFLNPHRAGENGEFIAAISEMRRLPAAFRTDWLPR